jgi:hypothetical protein
MNRAVVHSLLMVGLLAVTGAGFSQDRTDPRIKLKMEPKIQTPIDPGREPRLVPSAPAMKTPPKPSPDATAKKLPAPAIRQVVGIPRQAVKPGAAFKLSLVGSNLNALTAVDLMSGQQSQLKGLLERNSPATSARREVMFRVPVYSRKSRLTLKVSAQNDEIRLPQKYSVLIADARNSRNRLPQPQQAPAPGSGQTGSGQVGGSQNSPDDSSPAETMPTQPAPAPFVPVVLQTPALTAVGFNFDPVTLTVQALTAQGFNFHPVTITTSPLTAEGFNTDQPQ